MPCGLPEMADIAKFEPYARGQPVEFSPSFYDAGASTSAAKRGTYKYSTLWLDSRNAALDEADAKGPAAEVLCSGPESKGHSQPQSSSRIVSCIHLDMWQHEGVQAAGLGIHLE